MLNDLWGRELFNQVMHILCMTSKQMKNSEWKKLLIF